MDLPKQKAIIKSVFLDFMEAPDPTETSGYFAHVGFDIGNVPVGKVLDAWLGHYRIKQGCYDVERCLNDLATWPPIAARAEYLRSLAK